MISRQALHLNMEAFCHRKTNYKSALTYEGDYLTFRGKSLFGGKRRPYQEKLRQAILSRDPPFYFIVWPRRFGKDVIAFDALRELALTHVGRYLYCFPTLVSARRVFWNGGYELDGKYILNLDSIPNALVTKKNGATMVVKFKNGSILECGGMNRFDSLRGPRYDVALFSEFNFGDGPEALDVVMPSLLQSKGRGIIISTWNGKNFGYRRFQELKKDSNWRCEVLSIEEALDENGNRYISEEDIQTLRGSGMPEAMIQQEYYCKPLADTGLYWYAKEMDVLYEEGRISCALELKHPVYAALDLGRDGTPVIVWQYVDGEIRIIATHLWINSLVQEAVTWLLDYRTKKRCVLSEVFLPYDGKDKNIVTNTTPADIFKEHGFTVRVLPKVSSKFQSINLSRMYLGNTIIDKKENEKFMNMLETYKRRYNAITQVYEDSPVHDEASHYADAFQVISQAVDGKYVGCKNNPIGYYGESELKFGYDSSGFPDVGRGRDIAHYHL